MDLPWSDVPGLLIGGLVIALIGFAEPAAIARHYVTAERKRWDPSRELVSQGAANVVSGLVGGFPIGGSFSRTALAKLAGAKTRWNGVIVGVVMLATIPLLGFMSALPRATLGAVVITAVLPLVNLRPLLEFWRPARLQFYVAGITFVATLIAAPHVERGVVIGVLLAAAAHLYREVRLSVPTSEDAITVARKMAGRLTAADKGSRLEFTVFDIAANWHTGRFDRAVSMIDVLHHMDTGSQKEIFREAVFHVKAGGLLVYKDMCETPFCLAAANRLHDLLLARQWIHYRPIGQVEAWALDLGLTLVHAEEIRRYWYKHELRVFRR